MIPKLRDLYQRDERLGDSLIQPFRLLVRETSYIIVDLGLHSNQTILAQAKRIATIALFSLGILALAIPAACGMVRKILQPNRKKRSFRHFLAPPAPQTIQISQRLQMPQESTDKKNYISRLPNELLVFIGTFLNLEEQMAAMLISKLFCEQVRSPVIWSSYLNRENLRISGATRWKIETNEKSLHFSPENQNYLKKPYQQINYYIRAFHHHSSRIATQTNAFEYWSRLMSGGPLAFEAIPKVRLFISCNQLTPFDLQRPLRNIAAPLPRDNYRGFNVLNKTNAEAMSKTHPVLIGIDVDRVPFIVFNVKRVDELSLILFTYRCKEGQGVGDYYQQPNGPWKAEQLRLSNEKDLNYLLALLDKQPIREDLIDTYRLGGVVLNTPNLNEA